MSQEIETAVSAILTRAGVTCGAVYLGETLRDGWACDEWRVSFAKQNQTPERFDFFTGLGLRTKIEDTAAGRMAAQFLKRSNPNSIAWEQARKAHCKPKTPHAASVLYSLILDSAAAGQSFADWCADFGYETDSRKAFATYEACQISADKLRKIFNSAQIEELRAALENY